MKIEIKHRFNDSVLFSHEQEDNSIRITLEQAVKACAHLSYADLRDAYLIEAELEGATLRYANLRGANLSGAHLRGAHLSGANLNGAHLSDADMRDAYLEDSDLRDAYLIEAELEGANLEGADMRGVYLRDANMHGAYLEGANMRGGIYGEATLNRGMLQLLGKHWPVYIFDAHIKIGCQLNSTQEWESFSDVSISKMDSRALKFWKENKEMILTLAKNHQNKSGE